MAAGEVKKIKGCSKEDKIKKKTINSGGQNEQEAKTLFIRRKTKGGT